MTQPDPSLSGSSASGPDAASPDAASPDAASPDAASPDAAGPDAADTTRDGLEFKRTVVVENVLITAPGKTLVGINTNYGDTATLSGITIVGDSRKKISICDRFTGNSSGDEPTKTGSGPDGTFCKYDPAAVVYR